MPIEDARCPGCGTIPELVRGAWWPHAPGVDCKPLALAEACVDAVAAAVAKDRIQRPHEDGRVLCNPAEGMHAFQTGRPTCDCGQAAVSDEQAAEDAYTLDTLIEGPPVLPCDPAAGWHAFQVGARTCHCGQDSIDQATAQVAADAAAALEAAEDREDCGDGLHVFPDGGGRCRCGGDFLTIAPSPKPAATLPPWYMRP